EKDSAGYRLFRRAQELSWRIAWLDFSVMGCATPRHARGRRVSVSWCRASFVAIVLASGCADVVTVDPRPDGGGGGAGGSDSVVSIGHGGATVASSSTQAASSSSSGPQGCAATCVGLGTPMCDCSRPCGDQNNKPEQVSCNLAATGDKIECFCILQGV